ncbi:MAG: nucleotide pyrophosphohydrolase [Aerococcus viridans]|nr:MAG: nucleotide pyrophosphohydrolase [Aerococcus viridans]
MTSSMDKVNQFRDERNWRQFHNEKDLALSITLEASELLEIFQWKTAAEGLENLDAIKDELADVLIYAYMLADNLNLDIDDIIERKLIKNKEKYPVEKSRNNNSKYTEL